MLDDELVPLLDGSTSIKVSSTLEKATGKKNLIDGSPETCWTSQPGLPQFIQLGFNSRVIPKRLVITFQGGFVGTTCALYVPCEVPDRRDWQLLTTVYPEDVNRPQSFELIPTEPELLDAGISTLKLVFDQGSDFFGRITVYDLHVDGRVT